MEAIEFKGVLTMKKEPKGEYAFFMLQMGMIVLCLTLFQWLILTVNSAIFIVVINSILIAFASKLMNKALKNEIYKLIVIGFNLVFFEVLFEEKKGIILFLFNFYAIMYALFFLLYFKRFRFVNKEIQAYIYFVNCFLFFYFLLVNAEVVSATFFEDRYAHYIPHFYIGIKCVLLFISVLTLLQWGIKQVKNKNVQRGQE
ncbi:MULTISPECIES: hypothetical protein [unclassified Myroides]|uniref:hypothetical protein n=1 Tax=unclassified Myroides TaxID=2642485 RepID=UPI0015FAA48B|nr:MULTISPECIES: hypothetical protein [unclassified Myroides]MBB1151334.1 hypothetical protein [Myroides sp. NP-2]MDM1408417.1 hypothetical protein [Myroides sp. DF42-4-2]